MDYNEAADTLKRLARDREAMTFAADAFTGLGSIQQATKEAEAARSAAYASAQEVKAELESLQAQVNQAELRAKKILFDADSDASAKVAAASSRCAEMVRGAQAKIDAAAAQAAKEAEAARADVAAQLAEQRTAVNALRAEEAALLESIAAKEAQLVDQEARWQAVQDAAAALMKG
jgi:hypothetical protein